jgi:hypothetical protein
MGDKCNGEDFVWVTFLWNKQTSKEHHRLMTDLPLAASVCAQSSDALSRASAIEVSVLN